MRGKTTCVCCKIPLITCPSSRQCKSPLEITIVVTAPLVIATFVLFDIVRRSPVPKGKPMLLRAATGPECDAITVAGRRGAPRGDDGLF